MSDSGRKRPPTMADVAARANVSHQTVSRVLNNPATVRPETAARVQEAVRARVDDRTWEVFWRIAVEDAPIREVAEAAGLSYAAAFAAQKRVRRMLREEAAALADAGATA